MPAVVHVLVPEPPGELGGADMHVLDLARLQISAGARVVVMERGSSEFAQRARGCGIEVISASGLSFPAATRALADLIRQASPAVVHSHGYDADYWAAATKLRHGAAFRCRPLVCTQHGIVADTAWHRAKTALNAAAIRLADGVISCSPLLMPRMRRWCPRGIVRYIPNGVAPLPRPPRRTARMSLHLRYGVPTDRPLVGYVGRLAEEKRPDRVVEVVALLARAGVPAHAVIVGSGPLRADLERQSRAEGIDERVTFTGLVEDMALVYGGLDVLLLLSDTEATSRVTIEAMMAHVPVVASYVGGTPVLLGGGRFGRLVEPDDIAAAASRVREVLDGDRADVNAAYRHAMALHGIDQMGRRVADFYETLIARRATSDRCESSAATD